MNNCAISPDCAMQSYVDFPYIYKNRGDFLGNRPLF